MKVTEFPLQNVAQPRAEARPQARAATRLAYIDMIRVALIILVILVHAAGTYNTMGVWTFSDIHGVDDLTDILTTFFIFTCQSFFMGLFFFYSGYFTPGSYDKKGIGMYWKDRLLRLALPALVFTLALSRLPNYLDAIRNGGLNLSFWRFSLLTFLTEADAGPTWFLFALLALSIGYTLWRLATRRVESKRLAWVTRLSAPTTWTLLGFGLALAVIMFLISQWAPIAHEYRLFGAISMQVAFFPSYILLFIAGTWAFRSGWMEQLSGKAHGFWTVLSLALIPVMPAIFFLGGAMENGTQAFFSGWTWQHALVSLWLGLACVSFSMTLTLWMRRWVSSNSPLAAFTGPNTFGVYLIHPLVLVPITYAMSFTAIHPLIKFGLASISTVIVCFIVSEGLRQVPGLKRVL